MKIETSISINMPFFHAVLRVFNLNMFKITPQKRTATSNLHMQSDNNGNSKITIEWTGMRHIYLQIISRNSPIYIFHGQRGTIHIHIFYDCYKRVGDVTFRLDDLESILSEFFNFCFTTCTMCLCFSSICD